jgi:tetraacyldisaccharide 4'-kinase
MDTPMEQIGDEPWQMKQKFGNEIHVAVDANRPEGIRRLQEDKETSDTQVVLLDDAFQHGAIKAGLNILLIDCHRLICDDWLLPAGRLREPAKGANRADVVVVTKCPPDITPMDCRVIRTRLRLRPHQQLFFSTLRYDRLQALFGNDTRTLEQIKTEKASVLLVTGIASPRQMEQDLRPYASRITPLPFPDHHYYTAQDVRHICQALETLPAPRIIITTEKDATRLQGLQGLTPEARESPYVLPIRVEILQERNTKLNQIIEDYVRQNS